MPGVYDRRMFRMANGGMMPPPGGEMMPPPEGGMDPEMQRISQEIDSMPPEMQQAEAAKFFQQAMSSEVGSAVEQEVGRPCPVRLRGQGFLANP